MMAKLSRQNHYRDLTHTDTGPEGKTLGPFFGINQGCQSNARLCRASVIMLGWTSIHRQSKEWSVIDGQDWISQAQAARLCRVSPQTIRRWIDQKLLRVRKLPHGRLQVDRSTLDRVVQIIG